MLTKADEDREERESVLLSFAQSHVHLCFCLNCQVVMDSCLGCEKVTKETKHSPHHLMGVNKVEIVGGKLYGNVGNYLHFPCCTIGMNC
jgi:hypothetical protein